MGRKPNNKNHKLKVLSAWLEEENHSKFAKAIRISGTHLSLILSGKRKATMFVANRIIQETNLEVSLEDIRPDLHKEVMEITNRIKEKS